MDQAHNPLPITGKDDELNALSLPFWMEMCSRCLWVEGFKLKLCEVYCHYFQISLQPSSETVHPDLMNAMGKAKLA